jgi:hypothetical protein
MSQRVIAHEPGVEGRPTRNLLRKGPYTHVVNADYFRAMEMPLLQGRSFRPLDSAPGAERVVIIDEHLARKLRPDGSAVGSLIQHGWFSELTTCRVVGIVPSLQPRPGDIPDRSHLYEPFQPEQAPVYVHLRAARATWQAEAALLQSVAAQIREIDPRLPVVSVASLTDQHRQASAVRGMGVAAKLGAMFGTMALFLAGLGLYAVKGHLVASRTPEIGIRMALGATRRDMVALVFRQGAVSTVVGLSLGILLAAALTSLIRSGLYGVSPVDPVSIGATVILLAATSILAGYLPARRAARIDPMVALRYE